MNAQLARVSILLQQSRFDMAETECRRVLGDDPNDATATSLLALSLSGQKKYQEATTAAQTAISLAPDWNFPHYVLAEILDDRNRLDEAEQCLHEAIRLDPADPDQFALLSSLHAQRKRWADAVEAAEQGLALDAEHVSCANLRAMCLVKMGRKAEADQAIAAALAREPENAVTHANRGWTLLESGQHDQAMGHFREALRLEPEMEWARAGIVEAMKAKRLVYRLLLKYFFLMSRLTGRTRLAIVIGAVLLINLMGKVADRHPEQAVFLRPLIYLYLAFVVLTWIAQPLFNLLLRLDRFGRLALSEDQRKGANLFALCVLGALLSLCTGFILPLGWAALGAAAFALLLVPVSMIYNCPEGRPRVLMTLYALALAVIGVGTWATITLQSMEILIPRIVRREHAGTITVVFLFGVMLSTWLGAGLSAMKIRR